MSQLGFDKDLARLKREEIRFLREGMKVAQKEFKENFDGEKNSESGERWREVLRGNPPPILDVEGKLRKEALASGNVRITGNKAVLTVDPYETKRNRPYASYHMGDGQYERKFITQSDRLTKKQQDLLDEMFNRLTS